MNTRRCSEDQRCRPERKKHKKGSPEYKELQNKINDLDTANTELALNKRELQNKIEDLIVKQIDNTQKILIIAELCHDIKAKELRGLIDSANIDKIFQ